MRKHRKQIIAFMVAAAMVSSSITGCQPGGLSGKNQEAGESSEAESQIPGREEKESRENEKHSRGKAWEAGEPKRAEISPEDYEEWNQLLAENEISEAFKEGLDQFAYESGSAILRDAAGNENKPYL